jgi:small subunit ribosomal protein S26e
MPKKRRNNGRNKKHKGHSDAVHCENCHRLVPKDKAIKRFIIKNMVDGSSKRDIEEMSVYDKYSMPKLYLKNQYCVSCGIHARIVRVRSGEGRRVRYISKYRQDQREEHKKGFYIIAGTKYDIKKTGKSTSD